MLSASVANQSCSNNKIVHPGSQDQTLRITHIHIPMVYNIAQEKELEISGKGFLKSDIIEFVSNSSSAESTQASIKTQEEEKITVSFDQMLPQGKYNVFVKRDNSSILLGQTSINHVFNAQIPDKENMTIKGTVYSQGKGVANVWVSDGVLFAQTDENGVYYLPSKKENGYVFISVPSNYEVNHIHTVPQFYKNLTGISSQAEIADFELFQANNENHAVAFIADIHLANRTSDLAQFHKGFMEDIKQTKSYYTSKNIKFYGLTLGDQTWDQYWYTNNFSFTDYINQIKELDFPIYNVIGNHDYDPYVSNNDYLAAAPFRHVLGPTYYSMNIGKVHYVILDDMDYKNANGKLGVIGTRDFDNIISQTQLNWLKQDLEHVEDKNTPIVVAMHVPMYTNPNATGAFKENLKNSSALASALSSFGNVKIITGHTHINYRAKADNTNITEHNIGAVSATWWWTGHTGYADNHICKDGSPGGYAVWEAQGSDQMTYYKGIGFNKDYQFRAYDLNQVHITAEKFTPNANDTFKAKVPQIAGEYSVENKKNQILLNVWGYQDNWKISIQENGKELAYTRVSKKDPLHLISYDLKRINVNANPTSAFTTLNTAHMFLATASSPTSTIEITVEDQFGHKYQESMQRPKAFSTAIK